MYPIANIIATKMLFKASMNENKKDWIALECWQTWSYKEEPHSAKLRKLPKRTVEPDIRSIDQFYNTIMYQ